MHNQKSKSDDNKHGHRIDQQHAIKCVLFKVVGWCPTQQYVQHLNTTFFCDSTKEMSMQFQHGLALALALQSFLFVCFGLSCFAVKRVSLLAQRNRNAK